MTKHTPKHIQAPLPHCGGKRLYTTLHEAEKVKGDQELINHGKITLRVYRCLYGHHWHLTRDDQADRET